jgi:3-dehydroquinate synthase
MTLPEIDHRIDVSHAGGQYPVLVGHGLLKPGPHWEGLLSGHVLVVSNDRVSALYLDSLKASLTSATACDVLIVPDGEQHKQLSTWQQVLDALVTLGAQRDATVVALGGGVIGDLAGFAAASYMRGIGVIQVPTTLLAQVDAAVGGKTGVNHPRGKNLIGAFHAPRAVLADLDTLQSLDQRDYQAGLAEVVKYGAIRDPAFFVWLETQVEALNQRDRHTLTEAVARSVRNKAEVVAADEREGGVRAILNFGHSFGHALETAGAYTQLRHGEAVAIGMVLATQLSEALGRVPTGTHRRLSDLLSALGLPTAPPPGSDPAALLELMRLDKKNHSGALRLVLLDSLGQATVDTVAEGDILECLQRACW